MAKPLILYDGYCALCNRIIHFLEVRQQPDALEYVAQQSERGKLILTECGLGTQQLETLVFVENGRCYLRSTAALRAVCYLRFPWPLLYAFIIVPSFLRDPVYNLIAHNRYHWFGRLRE